MLHSSGGIHQNYYHCTAPPTLCAVCVLQLAVQHCSSLHLEIHQNYLLHWWTIAPLPILFSDAMLRKEWLEVNSESAAVEMNVSIFTESNWLFLWYHLSMAILASLCVKEWKYTIEKVTVGWWYCTKWWLWWNRLDDFIIWWWWWYNWWYDDGDEVDTMKTRCSSGYETGTVG